MKKSGLRLTAFLGVMVVWTVLMTAHSASSDEAETAGLKKDIQKILTRQDEILKEIKELKEDMDVVKVRCSS